MKYEPLNAKDYADTIIYKKRMPAGTGLYHQLHNNLPKKRSYATILNELGCYLFKNFDCFNITEQQLIELNRLVKLGTQIIDKYIPKTEQQNINLGTFPLYLFKATREFCMTRVSKDFLAKAKEDEDENHYGRELKYGTRVFLHSDICRDYMPRQVKSKMRKKFKKEYGVYPENIYIAVVFYLMPYVLGIKSADTTCDNDLLRMVLDNIKPTLHHKQCGANKKNIPQYNLDEDYAKFKRALLAGEFYGKSAFGIIDDIPKKYKISQRQAKLLINRFCAERGIKRITSFTKH